jgi:Tol biopolymer transport system component
MYGSCPWIRMTPNALETFNRSPQDAAMDMHPSVLPDGKKLVFRTNRSGTWDIWLKDLESGRELPLTANTTIEDWPLISADGLKVAYRVRDD